MGHLHLGLYKVFKVNEQSKFVKFGSLGSVVSSSHLHVKRIILRFLKKDVCIQSCIIIQVFSPVILPKSSLRATIQVMAETIPTPAKILNPTKFQIYSRKNLSLTMIPKYLTGYLLRNEWKI